MNIIITGATKGIGRATAQLLLEEGHRIVICARNQEDLDKLTAEWQSEFGEDNFYSMTCDMGLESDVEKFGSFALEQLGDIDVLINNAGIFIPGEIVNEPDGVLDQLIKVNLYSAYHLSRKVIPGMIKRGSGHIFNMCSVASIIALPNGGSYSISKFALLGFSKVLREELKDKNIKVTSILPGATWSASWKGVDLPHERLMEAKDIALCISNALKLSPSAVVEDIIIRPQLGDL